MPVVIAVLVIVVLLVFGVYWLIDAAKNKKAQDNMPPMPMGAPAGPNGMPGAPMPGGAPAGPNGASMGPTAPMPQPPAGN